MESVDAVMLSQELDTRVNHGIAPLLKSMALQQMDLKDKFESLWVGSHEEFAEFAGALQDTREDLSDLQSYTVKVGVEVEEVTKDLQKEMGVGNDRIQEAHEQLKALQVEVQNLAEHPSVGGNYILSAA